MLKKSLKKVLGSVVLAVMSTMLLAGNAFAADTINPTVPTNVRVVSSTCTSITLSWTASTDNVGIQKYTICNVTDLMTIDTGSNNTTYTVTGLQPNETYSFTVQALDTSGNGSPSSSMITVTTPADTVHPTAPTNVTVVSSTCTTMTLSWTASTDNVGIGKYTISNVTDLKNIDTGSNNTTYTVTGLKPNKSYSFTVQCLDTSGNGSPSSSMITGTTPADTVNPTAPTNVTVVSVTSTSVTLSWTASTDNVGIKNYTISNVTDLQNIDTGSNNTTYTVTGLQPNKSYSFTVQCLDTSGNGSPSSSMITAKTLQ